MLFFVDGGDFAAFFFFFLPLKWSKGENDTMILIFFYCLGGLFGLP